MSTEAAPLLPHATRDIAAFAAGLRFEDLPARVVDQAKLNLLDGIGVCLHGATLPWTRLLHQVVLAEGATPAVSLWGTGAKGSWAQAALANGTAGHAFEMDDIHKESVLHPNSLTSPISLGFAEARGATGKQMLAAIVAGYECGTRVGNAATTALFLNGFHPQGTSGTIVAAATAGSLMGLDAAAMQNAFGIAGSCAAGLMAAQEGAMVKRLHAGRAGESGVRAAELASRGFTGISDIFEAPYGGFLSSLARTPKPEKLTAGLGTVWETLNTGFKMYPTVTSIHAALDSLRRVMADAKLADAVIEQLTGRDFGGNALRIEISERRDSRPTAGPGERRSGTGAAPSPASRKAVNKVVHADSVDAEAPDPRWAGELSKLKSLLANQTVGV